MQYTNTNEIWECSTVATATSANLSTVEAAATNLPVPVDTAALSSAGKAIAEAAAADVSFKTAASKTDEEEKATLDVAEEKKTEQRGQRGERNGLILHQFIYDMNSYFK